MEFSNTPAGTRPPTKERVELIRIYSKEPVYKTPDLAKTGDYNPGRIERAKDMVTFRAFHEILSLRTDGKIPEKFSADFEITVGETFAPEPGSMNVDITIVVYIEQDIDHIILPKVEPR